MFQANNLPDWQIFGGSVLRECTSDMENPTTEQRDQCLGTSLMARMSFILMLFHFLVFLITLARNSAAAAFHDGCWAFKYALVAVAFFASLWLPN